MRPGVDKVFFQAVGPSACLFVRYLVVHTLDQGGSWFLIMKGNEAVI